VRPRSSDFASSPFLNSPMSPNKTQFSVAYAYRSALGAVSGYRFLGTLPSEMDRTDSKVVIAIHIPSVFPLVR